MIGVPHIIGTYIFWHFLAFCWRISSTFFFGGVNRWSMVVLCCFFWSTPPKFYMEPEKWWFPRGARDFFSGSMLIFGGVYFTYFTNIIFGRRLWLLSTSYPVSLIPVIPILNPTNPHTHTHLACSWNQQPSTKTTLIISYILTMFFSECRISQLYPFTLRFLGYQSGIESSMQLYQLSSSQRDYFGLPKIAR